MTLTKEKVKKQDKLQHALPPAHDTRSRYPLAIPLILIPVPGKTCLKFHTALTNANPRRRHTLYLHNNHPSLSHLYLNSHPCSSQLPISNIIPFSHFSVSIILKSNSSPRLPVHLPSTFPNGLQSEEAQRIYQKPLPHLKSSFCTEISHLRNQILHNSQILSLSLRMSVWVLNCCTQKSNTRGAKPRLINQILDLGAHLWRNRRDARFWGSVMVLGCALHAALKETSSSREAALVC